MNPDDDALIDAELSDAERHQVQAFYSVAAWIDALWPDGEAANVLAFLDSCVDVIRLPAHPDSSGNRPAVIARLREIAEMKLEKIKQPKE
ncbi:MAG: hypothetical protein IT428_18035 [Planctomycetaceae bacterium]|nr:hypothetical protein [Planctomycetaceae bacterium]